MVHTFRVTGNCEKYQNYGEDRCVSFLSIHRGWTCIFSTRFFTLWHSKCIRNASFTTLRNFIYAKPHNINTADNLYKVYYHKSINAYRYYRLWQTDVSLLIWRKGAAACTKDTYTNCSLLNSLQIEQSYQREFSNTKINAMKKINSILVRNIIYNNFS